VGGWGGVKITPTLHNAKRSKKTQIKIADYLTEIARKGRVRERRGRRGVEESGGQGAGKDAAYAERRWLKRKSTTTKSNSKGDLEPRGVGRVGEMPKQRMSRRVTKGLRSGGFFSEGDGRQPKDRSGKD